MEQILRRDGDEDRSLFFLARGQAKVTKQGRLLSVLSTGEYFGEMAYLKAFRRQASVESITDALLSEFDSELLRATSANCRLHLAHALLDSLVERLRIANERLMPRAILNPRE